ncbi:MAG: zf-HC2 domain-containing protein [Ignavibacteriales bacterium]|nr:zf-HC2 domain-containing protein [Ignavibacteriales bacterium]
MNHLSVEQVFRYVDGTVQSAERQQLEEHLSYCSRCRREIDLQKNLGRVAQKLPLVKPSARFTERVMTSVLPKSQPTWVTKIINNLGNMFAMILVLGVLGYVLFSPSLKIQTQSSQPSQYSEALKTFSGFYEKFSKAMTTQSAQLTKGVATNSSEGGTKILVFTLVCLIVLGTLDKFVLQKKIRLKS